MNAHERNVSARALEAAAEYAANPFNVSREDDPTIWLRDRASEIRAMDPSPTQYLSRTELADRIGVKPDTLGRYKLPEPDAMIGSTRGWTVETIDAWNTARPGRGAGPGRQPGK